MHYITITEYRRQQHYRQYKSSSSNSDIDSQFIIFSSNRAHFSYKKIKNVFYFDTTTSQYYNIMPSLVQNRVIRL